MKSVLGELEGEKQLLLTKWGGGGEAELLDLSGRAGLVGAHSS